MNQSLVLLTLEYPHPLLDKELPFLAESFDKIYLLPGVLHDFNQVPLNIALPKNVEIFSIFKTTNLRNPLQLLLKYLPAIVRIYGSQLRYSGYRKTYLHYWKSFLGHLVKEAEKVSPLKKFITEHELNDALFYDYWLVDSTIALAELKRKGLIKHSVARAHGFDLYHERQFEKHVPFQEYRIKHLNAVFTISKHGYYYLKSKLHGELRSKIKLNYLGVQNIRLGKLPVKDASHYTLVSCARLIPLKRIDLLVNVLKSSRLSIHWIHFGDGPEFSSIKVKIRSMPANIKVDFRGEVPNDEVLKFYERQYVDLFLSVSESEGLPVSMMEAISFGIPVFACGINGVPEIVNSQTGVLVDVKASSEQLLTALEQTLLTEKFDREAIYKYYNKHFNAIENCRMFIKEIKKIAFNTKSNFR